MIAPQLDDVDPVRGPVAGRRGRAAREPAPQQPRRVRELADVAGRRLAGALVILSWKTRQTCSPSQAIVSGPLLG